MKKKYWFIFFLCLVTSLILIISVKKGNSITTDEPATILSGYSIVKEGIFDLHPETPPFAKMLIVLPLKYLDLNPTIDHPIERLKNIHKNYVNFFGRNNYSIDEILFYTSIPLLILFIIFSIFMANWLYEIGGFYGGLFGFISIIFSPFYLGHTLICQTDFIISFGYALCFYFFLKSLKNYKYLIGFSIFLGFTLASKFSAIFLIPFTTIIFLFFFLKQKKIDFKFIIFYILSVFFGILILFSFYFYATRNLNIKEEKEIIKITLKKFPESEKEIKKLQTLAETSKELSHLLLGISYLDLLNRYQRGISYVIGKKSITGFWYFFPFAFLLKNPISYLILLIVCIFYKKIDFNSFIILIPIILYFLITMSSSYNYGIRHLSCIFPLISVFISYRLREMKFKKYISLFFSLIFFLEVILNYPNYISYFNFLFNKNPEKYLIDSNLDWGQDWKRASLFAKEKKIEEPILIYEGNFPYENFFKKGKRITESLTISGKSCYIISINTKKTAVLYYALLKNFEVSNAFKNLFEFLEKGKFKKVKIEKSIEIYIPKCYNK